MVLVVVGALGGVVEDLVGLADRVESGRGAGVVADVGVVLAREAPIGAADLVRARVLGYAKHPVMLAAKIDASRLAQRCVLSRCRYKPAAAGNAGELVGGVPDCRDAYGSRLALPGA